MFNNEGLRTEPDPFVEKVEKKVRKANAAHQAILQQQQNLQQQQAQLPRKRSKTIQKRFQEIQKRCQTPPRAQKLI